MKPIKFDEHNCVYAEDQPQYLPLPVYKDSNGRVISCWRFSFRERLRVLFGAPLWFHALTFNRPLQAQMPTLNYPFVTHKEED